MVGVKRLFPRGLEYHTIVPMTLYITMQIIRGAQQ